MDEKKLNTSIKSKLIAVTSLLLLLCLFGVTYAYFSIQVQGNEEASSVDVATARLSLIYTDVQIIMGEYEQPGWTDSKVLTVENNGTDTVSYALKWRELENTLVNGELVISATCTSTSGSCSNIPETVVPNAPTEVTSVYVYGPVSIAPGVKHTYNLTASFKEIGSNQNYNQNKYFNGTLNVDVDSANYSNDWENSYTVTFDANGGTTPISSKEVTVGLPYGELPTPTRSGYTFKGWNGKNMFNTKDVATLTKNGVTFSASNGIISLSGTNTASSAYGINSYYGVPVIDPSKSYTLSVSNNIPGVYVQINYKKMSTTSQGAFINMNIGSLKSKTAVAPSDFDNLVYLFVGIYGTATSINGQFTIQLEEGTTATPYEPYYIKADTRVVQKQDHTLTAIWE